MCAGKNTMNKSGMKTLADGAAEAKADKGLAEPGRRRFLNRLWALLGLAAAAEFCFLGASFLLSRKKSGEQAAAENIIDAGQADLFKPGTVTPIPQGGFYLSRLPDGGFLALSRVCTHLGCSLTFNAKEGRFVCPCHGSSFSPEGEPLAGPAGRPLDYYPTRIENGMVRVDAGRAIRRERFERDQAARI